MNQRRIRVLISGALAALAIAGTSVVAFAIEGAPAAATVKKTAPEFSAPGSDGKTHDLESLTADTPCFFYFIKDACPVNEPIVKYMNRVAAAYDGKVKFVGVFFGDEDTFKKFQERHKVPFTVLFDADKSLIKGFKIGKSPESVLVAKGGEILAHWKGVSGSVLNEMSASMAKAAMVEAVKVDTAGAPEAARQG
jgi:peroxiredoxin